MLWLYIGNRSIVQGVTRSDVERGTYHAEKRRGYGLRLKRRGSRNLGPTEAGFAREPADIRRGQCSSKTSQFVWRFHSRGCNAVATTTTYNRVASSELPSHKLFPEPLEGIRDENLSKQVRQLVLSIHLFYGHVTSLMWVVGHRLFTLSRGSSSVLIYYTIFATTARTNTCQCK